MKYLKSIIAILIVALLIPFSAGNLFAQQKDGNKQSTEQSSVKKSGHKKHRKHHKKHKKSKKTSKDSKNNNSNNSTNKNQNKK